MKPLEQQFSPRIRFNWGYWDGRAARKAGVIRRRHTGDAYLAGFKAGLDSGESPEECESSEPAWKAHKGVER